MAKWELTDAVKWCIANEAKMQFELRADINQFQITVSKGEHHVVKAHTPEMALTYSDAIVALAVAELKAFVEKSES